MSCGVGHRCSSDPTLLWLWRRPMATAPIRPLAWEPPYTTGAAQEKAKRQKKKKKEKRKSGRFSGVEMQTVSSSRRVLVLLCKPCLLLLFPHNCWSALGCDRQTTLHFLEVQQESRFQKELYNVKYTWSLNNTGLKFVGPLISEFFFNKLCKNILKFTTLWKNLWTNHVA